MKSIFFFSLLLQIAGVAAQTNVALNQPTEASPTIVHDKSTAVNGDTSGNNMYHSQEIPNAYWQVELSSTSDVCSVDQIVIWDRLDSAYWYRMAGYVIEFWDGNPLTTGNLLESSAPLSATPVGRKQTVNFAPVTNVRYVRITKAAQGILTLSEVQIFGTCGLAPSVGAGGDPHIKLFNGRQYDFHGHCDLLLIESPSVADGAGLTIHVRSSPYKEIFSYISEAAIQIGDRVLTIGSGGQHAIDGVPQKLGKTGSLVVDDLHQYPVQSSATWKGRRVYKIHLGDGPHGKEEIVIREFKNWITVSIIHPSAANLEKSKGLLGRFPDGALLGKDGKTIHTSYDNFGQDWQVPPGDSLLGPGPFLDSSCAPLQALKDIRLRGRRLGESPITRAQAMQACKHWGSQMEDCINDVQISGDLEMANTAPL